MEQEMPLRYDCNDVEILSVKVEKVIIQNEYCYTNNTMTYLNLVGGLFLKKFEAYQLWW